MRYSWLLCSKNGQALEEVLWEMQKQLWVGLYDNAEHLYHVQLDREVLNGVAIERNVAAANSFSFIFLSKISKRSSLKPDLTKLILPLAFAALEIWTV